MSSLLVVGTIAYDSIETPYGKQDEILGGSASYFAAAASHLTPVRIVAPVGEDFAHEHVLADQGIDLAGVQRMEGRTFRWKGIYKGAMNEAVTLKTELNVLERFEPVIPEEFKQSEYLFLANIDPTTQKQTLAKLDAAKVVACDTMNYWIDGFRDSLVSLLPLIGILIINETECRSLSNEQNMTAAIGRIHEMGPETVVVKRGEYGVLASHHGSLFALPGLPLESVKDPTGAGDSFAGGFMGYLAGNSKGVELASLRKAVVYGSIMASFAVQEFGLAGLLRMTSEDIKKRYRSFVELTRFED